MKVNVLDTTNIECYLTDEDERRVKDYMNLHNCDKCDAVMQMYEYGDLPLEEINFSTECIEEVEFELDEEESADDEE